MLVVAGACASESTDQKALVIGGIPDQYVSVLEERFGAVAVYLSNELGIAVEYVPVTDYSSLVNAFKNGDVMLGWFGGLTSVQARSFIPAADSIAQRPRDQEFTSVFIVNSNSSATSLSDLKGTRFTFGSTNSTSGHLMPRSFLLESGVDPDSDFKGVPNYSGSHDLTWKLVASGSFDAGVLNTSVWERAVAGGAVDTSRVRVLYESPEFVDYSWVAHPDIDLVWGEGTISRITEALLSLSGDNELTARILELFETDSFIPARTADYSTIEEIARSLNMLP